MDITTPLDRVQDRAPLDRRAVMLSAAVMLLVIAFAVSLLLGSVAIPLGEIVTILLGGEPTRATWTTIVMQFRLPKAITASLAGASLAVGGVMMQTLFRNPLADPYVLGVSAGAGLGVALVVLAGGAVGAIAPQGFALVGVLGDAAIAGAAAVGAAGALTLALVVARRVPGIATLLLVGVMIGYAAGAIVTLLAHFSIPERLQAYTSWTAGSFGGVTWSQLPILAGVTLMGITVAAASVKPLNALLLGEDYAASMGIHVRRARALITIAAALLAGGVTAFCGPIGFVGIAVPHVARALLKTADHRWLLPASALLGGAFALIVDVIAAWPGGQVVLPLNAITALVGAPIVIFVIVRRARGVMGDRG